MDKEWFERADKEISKVFNRFAGKIVNPADPHDKVLEAMRLEATMHYSYLRLIGAGETPAQDGAKITRINAELENAGDGKWRIGNRFFRG